jgi:hypothetical protein
VEKGVVTTFKGEQKKFSVFEGSQAVPAGPSDGGTFEGE